MIPMDRSWMGLSPRVRGNRLSVAAGQRVERSIPACTGEPRHHVGIRCQRWVYPRVYGGTDLLFLVKRFNQGLSPRVRGNRCKDAMEMCPLGSIPACTGEPRTFDIPGVCAQVYPRVYGGTGLPKALHRRLAGLSPRVRGNHILLLSTTPLLGSIPACTGEPSEGIQQTLIFTVYPRVYGGTSMSSQTRLTSSGLSPRVRGNPKEKAGERESDRSIPACTGEPLLVSSRPLPAWVYPRVYGGTCAVGYMNERHYGLSPRVRGNQSCYIDSGRD